MLKARTTGAIALTPTGNAHGPYLIVSTLQGGYIFLSLTTGQKLSRQQWEELPMPDGVVQAVEQIALTEQQPFIGNKAPLFEWSPGVASDDSEEIIIKDSNDAV